MELTRLGREEVMSDVQQLARSLQQVGQECIQLWSVFCADRRHALFIPVLIHISKLSLELVNSYATADYWDDQTFFIDRATAI